MDMLKAYLKEQIEACASREVALANDGRTDEAVLEKIRGNVYGIFVSVIEAGEKTCSTPEGLSEFFGNNLKRIPAGWRIAREKAAARDDAVRLAQEDVKLAAIDDISAAFAKMGGAS